MPGYGGAALTDYDYWGEQQTQQASAPPASSTQSGSSTRRYRAQAAVVAKVERSTVKIGAALRIYSPKILEILGGETL